MLQGNEGGAASFCTREPVVNHWRQGACLKSGVEPFEFLIGEWRTTGSHPEIPGKDLRGRTSFAWHEGGAFLIMRAEIDDPQFPNGLAIIGSDDDAGRFVMTYF